MSRNKYPNKRMFSRSGNGRFKKAQLSDFNMGVCPVCQNITVRIYEGDPKDPFPYPLLFRWRCYKCEPSTEEEKAKREREIKEEKSSQTTLMDLLKRTCDDIEDIKKVLGEE